MKIIITGATGMVGEGILLECLENPLINEVLSVSRRSAAKTHPKLKEIIVSDFLMLSENDERFRNYDACFFCAGVSSIGMKAEEYKRITYDTTMNFAKSVNPASNTTFIYVSGAGTDSSEKGRLFWARIKGKTENDLMKLPFKQVFAFRPGFIKAGSNQKFLASFYKYISWLFPLIELVMPSLVTSMNQLSLAMINCVQNGYVRNVIEVKDIKILSSKSSMEII